MGLGPVRHRARKFVQYGRRTISVGFLSCHQIELAQQQRRFPHGRYPECIHELAIQVNPFPIRRIVVGILLPVSLRPHVLDRSGLRIERKRVNIVALYAPDSVRLVGAPGQDSAVSGGARDGACSRHHARIPGDPVAPWQQPQQGFRLDLCIRFSALLEAIDLLVREHLCPGSHLRVSALLARDCLQGAYPCLGRIESPVVVPQFFVRVGRTRKPIGPKFRRRILSGGTRIRGRRTPCTHLPSLCPEGAEF